MLVDTRPVGHSATLSQKSPESLPLKSIGYDSRELTPVATLAVEQRYLQTEKEALAIL